MRFTSISISRGQSYIGRPFGFVIILDGGGLSHPLYRANASRFDALLVIVRRLECKVASERDASGRDLDVFFSEREGSGGGVVAFCVGFLRLKRSEASPYKVVSTW